MSREHVVLDAAGLDAAATNRQLRALLRRTVERGGEVCCAAVTIAEVARGGRRAAAVRNTLTTRLGGEPIRIQPTDTDLAFLVGALLSDAALGSEALADAHVVATCARAPQALVITSDPRDIHALAAHVPGVRIVTRRPDLRA